MRKLAIVGSHPKTRELAPYEDAEYEVWLFNEAAQKVSVYRRWDAVIQIHKPEVYTSLENWVNKDHWAWLQQDHGEGKRIFMQEADPRVPNSVRYPLEEVLALTPFEYLKSSPAMALALGIYLGYEWIELYGSELTSGTEYAYQAANLAFWVGFAVGRGVHFEMKCWEREFWQPVYGYAGEAQIDKSLYEQRRAENEAAWVKNDESLRRLKDRLDQAMLEGKYQEVATISLEMQTQATITGETAGAMGEAERYAGRGDMISRQEFERRAAQAQMDGEGLENDMHHEAGKVEYVWNVWKMTGRLEALNQLRGFIREKTRLAYESGVNLGIYRENIRYINTYDELVESLGGQRAVRQVTAGLKAVDMGLRG